MEVIQNNNTVPQGENLSVWGYFVRCITKKYSDFSGRARRKEWWSFALFELLITSLLGIPVGKTFGKDFAADPEMVQYMAQNPSDMQQYVYSLLGSNVFFWVLVIVGILLLVPTLAVGCRRFHDVGISTGVFWVVGGLTVLSSIVGVLQVIAPGVIPQALSGIVSFLSLLASLAMLVIAFIPGKIGPNAYGPDPKPAPTYEGYGQI